MSRAVVTRLSKDNLQEEVWAFSLISDSSGCRIVLERYVRFTRKSKRHRWQTADRYELYASNERTLDKPVTPPMDVSQEALDVLIRGICTAMEKLLTGTRAAPRRGESFTKGHTLAA